MIKRYDSRSSPPQASERTCNRHRNEPGDYLAERSQAPFMTVGVDCRTSEWRHPVCKDSIGWHASFTLSRRHRWPLSATARTEPGGWLEKQSFKANAGRSNSQLDQPACVLGSTLPDSYSSRFSIIRFSCTVHSGSGVSTRLPVVFVFFCVSSVSLHEMKTIQSSTNSGRTFWKLVFSVEFRHSFECHSGTEDISFSRWKTNMHPYVIETVVDFHRSSVFMAFGTVVDCLDMMTETGFRFSGEWAKLNRLSMPI